MSASPLQSPVPLEKSHDLSAFACGAAPLNDYLHRYALQNHQNRSARTYVALRADRVVGYYSLAAGQCDATKQRPASPRASLIIRCLFSFSPAWPSIKAKREKASVRLC
jgi:hypothetical protein